MPRVNRKSLASESGRARIETVDRLSYALPLYAFAHVKQTSPKWSIHAFPTQCAAALTLAMATTIVVTRIRRNRLSGQLRRPPTSLEALPRQVQMLGSICFKNVPNGSLGDRL